MRKGVFLAIAATCLVVAAGYAALAAVRARSDPASGGVDPAARSAVAALGTARAQVLFQHAGRGAHRSQIAIAPAVRAGRRAIAGRTCARVYFAGRRGICLENKPSPLGARYVADVLGPKLAVRASVEMPGIPSRARVSRDGRYGAVTGFVTGHSYREKGFSTNTVLLDLAGGTRASQLVVADLEEFRVLRDGRTLRSIDFNFWGVTFAAESDHFYATLATGGEIYLVEGSIRARTVEVLHENVECPSLSPDGTRVAFKKRVGDKWRLSVLDLETKWETPLAEARSVDDQAEWLDNGHVLYGLGGDVWSVRADGRGRPSVFLADAQSPAVVRAGGQA